MGDVVDDAGDAGQYNHAKEIFYQLPAAGVKFLIQPGNHDNWSGNGASYWHYFGADSKEYMDLTNDYLTTKAWSAAMFLEAGDYTYMVISLANEGGTTSWNPTSGELEWFESMLQQYPNCPTIVTPPRHPELLGHAAQRHPAEQRGQQTLGHCEEVSPGFPDGGRPQPRLRRGNPPERRR